MKTLTLKSLLFALAGMLLALTTPVQANEVHLHGTLRDFQQSHPDFENHANWQFPLITGMVMENIGPDRKPMLNIGGGCTKIYASSFKDLSNVVLKLDDGTEYKYDNLNQGGTGYFEVPAAHIGKEIVGAWIKAGRNSSGDGPGYGEHFQSDFLQFGETHTVSNNESRRRLITVTFFMDGGPTGIDPQWRIQSDETFNQWFRNVEGVNMSKPHSITLTDPEGDKIFRYEASKHNGKSFFPLDGELYGNEGNAHNYHFTYEIHTHFRFIDPAARDNDLIFNFSGDDDVWVFINGKLVIDLGGVHAERYASVNIDEIADELGLEPGGFYQLEFFFAERHKVESNFTIETSLEFLEALYD